MITTKQNWLKRSLSLLLVLVMCMGMFSVTAFAEEEKTKLPAPTVEDLSKSLTFDGFIDTSSYWELVISSSVSGTQLYYTVDGTEPNKETSASASRSLQITQYFMDKNNIEGNVFTVKVLATAPGYSDSDIVAFEFKLLPEEGVAFAESALKSAVWNALGKQGDAVSGIITQAEMESLTSLIAENSGITDLKGLQYATNLEVLDLSGNDLNAFMKNNASGTFQFQEWTKLKKVDLSDCNMGSFGSDYRDQTLNKIANLLSLNHDLETLDVSGNKMVGSVTINTANKDKLRELDFSDNYLSGIIFQDDVGASEFNGAAFFPALTKLDFSKNCYEHKETSACYKDMLTFSENVLNVSNERSLATALAVAFLDANSSVVNDSSPKTAIDQTSKTVDAGFTTADAISFVVYSADTSGLTKATVQGESYTVLSSKEPDYKAARYLITASGLKLGKNEITVSLLQQNGATDTFTVIVTRNGLPSSDKNDSAGVTDPQLYEAVASMIDINGEYITKDDMASLTGTLTVKNAANLNGLQYATNLTGLVIGDGNYSSIPDISGMTKLTVLSVTSSNVTNLPDLTKFLNLTSLTLKCAKLSSVPQLANSTALMNITLALGNLNTLPIIPEFSANSWDYITLTLGDADGNFSYAGLSDAAINTVLDQNQKIRTLNIYNAPNLKKLGESTTNASQLQKLVIDGCPNFEKVGATLSNLRNLEFYGNDKEMSFTFEGLENCRPGKLNVTLYNVKNAEVKNLAENNGALLGLTFRYSDNIVLPAEIGTSSIQNLSVYYGNGNIMLPDTLKNSSLTNLTFWATDPIGAAPDVIYDTTSLTKLTIRSCGYLPELSEKIGQLQNLIYLYISQGTFDTLPKSLFTLTKLTELDILTTNIADISGDWSVFADLKTLNFENNKIQEIPASIADCEKLTGIYFYQNYITSIPEGFFAKLSEKSTVSISAYYERDYIDNTSAETKIASLSDEKLRANFSEYKGRWMNFFLQPNLADILKVEVDGQITYPGSDTEITVSLPKGTTEFSFTPYTILDGTEITYNDSVTNTGNPVTVKELKDGLNTIPFTASYTGKSGMATTDYTLSIYVGDRVSQDSMEEGKAYSIAMRYVMAASDTNSMTNNYFLHRERVVKENGVYAVDLTTTALDFIGYMDYIGVDGEMVRAEVVRSDAINNSCTWRVYVKDLDEALTISPMVYPMGYAPTCRVLFDSNSIMPYSAEDIDNPELSPAVDVTDKATDIIVHADRGVLPEGTKVVAEEITSKDNLIAAAEALNGIDGTFHLYNIYFADENGERIVPNGTVTVSFPAASGANGENLQLYRIGSDGSRVLSKGSLAEGYYIVPLRNFDSPYALVDTSKDHTANPENPGTSTGDNNPDTNVSGSPQTGDNSNTIIWLLPALVSAGMLCVLAFTRKRRVSEGE